MLFLGGENVFGNRFSFDVPKPWNVCKSRRGKEVLLFTDAVQDTNSKVDKYIYEKYC